MLMIFFDILPKQGAMALLKMHIKGDKYDDLSKLADTLACRVLPVSQAAAYIANTPDCSASEYLALYQKKRHLIVTNRPA